MDDQRTKKRNPADSIRRTGAIYDVEASLERLRQNRNAEGVLHFFQELMGAEFLVPCEGQALNVAVLNTEKGDRLIPVFTSAEELKPAMERWREVTALRLEFLALSVVTQPGQFTGLAVNPLRGQGILIGREDILKAWKLLKAYRNKELN